MGKLLPRWIVTAIVALLFVANTINIGADLAAMGSAVQLVAGHFAFLIFSLGIIGTGLLAIPVLASSAAYAIGEARGWETGLENMPWQAKGFYSVIGAATLLGIGVMAAAAVAMLVV